MSETGSAAGPPGPELGARLAAMEGRLRLLLDHLAGRALRARVDVEDLLQEVYLRALSRPERLPPPEPGEAALQRYLVRVARNAVIDAARALRAAKRDGREQRLESSSAEASRSGAGPGLRASRLAARTAGPLTRLALDEGLRRIQARFAALAPEHRRVIGLRQFEGLSARETARRMGRSESAVHSLYRRALLAWGVDDPDASR